MSASFLADAEAILHRIDLLMGRLETHAPRHAAVQDAARELARAFAERSAVTGRPVTLHTDGEGYFLDGQRLGFDVFGHHRATRTLGWMTALGANELRAHPPIDLASVQAFLEELQAAREEGVLRPVLADARAGRVSVRARPHLRLREDIPTAEGLAMDLETIASWVQDALPAAADGRCPTLTLRRALWRVADRAETDLSAGADGGRAFAIALRADGDDALHRHLARTAMLTLAFSLGLGLDAHHAVEETVCSLEGSLGLASLGSGWWRAEGATMAEALRARTPQSGLDDAWANERAVRIEELALLHAGGPTDIPFTLEASVFAAAAWFDRVRQGLQTQVPRCTPTQARTALDPWARRRTGLPAGLPFAMGALLGPVPPGSIVRCEGLPGVLRSGTEVAVVDGTGAMQLRSGAAGVAAAASEPPSIAPGYLAARP